MLPGAASAFKGKPVRVLKGSAEAMEVLLACLLLVWAAWGAQGSTVSLHKTNDQDGRCIYSFTVPSANEASCPSREETVTAIQALQRESTAQRVELESARARLGLLENLVDQLHGSQVVRGSSLSVMGLLRREVDSLKREQAQRDSQVSKLEATISNLLQDKSGLEEAKRQLEEEKNALERRLESSIQEVAQLRQSQCTQTGEVRSRDSLQGSKEGRLGFLCHLEQIIARGSAFCLKARKTVWLRPANAFYNFIIIRDALD